MEHNFLKKISMLLAVMYSIVPGGLQANHTTEEAKIAQIYNDTAQKLGIPQTEIPTLNFVDYSNVNIEHKKFLKNKSPWWIDRDFKTLYINKNKQLIDKDYRIIAQHVLSDVQKNIAFNNNRIDSTKNDDVLTPEEQTSLAPLIVKDYVPARDREYITIISTLAGGPGIVDLSTLKYNQEDADGLDKRSPGGYVHEEPAHGIEKLEIKVFFYNNECVGYITYNIKTPPYVGHIDEFVIDPKFQGKGYGKKIITYVLQDLQKMGVQKVEIQTGITNIHAQKLYGQFFTTINSDESYVYYIKYFMKPSISSWTQELKAWVDSYLSGTGK